MSGPPRNLPAHESSQRDRARIRQVLEEHARQHPLARWPNACELRRLTGLALSDRRFQQHVAAIRLEADAIAFAQRNVSEGEPSLR